MNELEEALKGSDDELSFYLGDVSCDEFRAHILEIKKKHANKAVIEEAIKGLQSLL